MQNNGPNIFSSIHTYDNFHPIENLHLTNHFHLKRLLIFFIQLTVIIQSLVFVQNPFFIHIKISCDLHLSSKLNEFHLVYMSWQGVHPQDPLLPKLPFEITGKYRIYTSKNSRNLRSTPIAFKLFLVFFLIDFNISTFWISNWTFLDYPLSSFNFREYKAISAHPLSQNQGFFCLSCPYLYLTSIPKRIDDPLWIKCVCKV